MTLTFQIVSLNYGLELLNQACHDFLQSDYLVDDSLIVCNGFRGKPLTITCQRLRLEPMNHPQQLNSLFNDLVQSLSDRPQDALEQLSIRGKLLR